MTESTRQSVKFQELASKPIAIEFDGEAQSSDGGALLLGAMDELMGLCAEISKHIVDRRDPARVDHSSQDLLRQRVFGIALGYADANDAATLRRDPVLRTLCNKQPLVGVGLGSQPTISRFENAPSAREQVAMARGYEVGVIKYLKKTHKRASLITIDLDSSEDKTHGQQVFAFFNGHHDSWCFLPQFAFISIDDDPDQYLFHARLRPGNAAHAHAVIPLLRRTIHRLRRTFPGARIRVRMDGAYSTPAILQLLDSEDVEYVIAMASNNVLLREAKPFMAEARQQAYDKNETAKVFGAFEYKAGTWSHRRRVVVKAEVVAFGDRELRDNPRFVITNMSQRPRRIYEIYRGRGDSENRIKELKLDLQIDRTSCSRFLANQFRVTMTAIAYALYQQLRARLNKTQLGRGTVATIRNRLIKIGTRVVESARRLVFHFPAAYPFAELWQRLALSLGALRG